MQRTFLASTINQIEITRLLLDSGAKDLKYKGNNNALDMTCIHGYEEIVNKFENLFQVIFYNYIIHNFIILYIMSDKNINVYEIQNYNISFGFFYLIQNILNYRSVFCACILRSKCVTDSNLKWKVGKNTYQKHHRCHMLQQLS